MEKTIILKVPGVEVEAKNRSKMNQKLKFSWEGLIFSIFMDFGPFLRPSWRHVGVQVDPKSMRKRHWKKGAKKEASWKRLGASWNVLEPSWRRLDP